MKPEIAGTKWQEDDIEAVAVVLGVITTVRERIAAIQKARTVSP
jgi:hypothetical protein